MMGNEHRASIFGQHPYCEILAMIPKGAQNARHSRELASSLGMRDRVFRKHLEQIRRNGVVIIGNNRGYFYPADIEELNAYIRQEEASARSILYTLKSARMLRKHWEYSVFNYSFFNNGGYQDE